MFLSDIMDISTFTNIVRQYGKKIMLLSGVGSGKSTWVKSVLAEDGNVLFITSRRAKVDEDVNNSDFQNYIDNDVVFNSHQTLITNAKICSLVQNIVLDARYSLDDFLSNYKYVVIDEVHSIGADSSFAESAFGLLSFMEYAVEYAKRKNLVVITMTGTPESVYSYFREKKWHIIDLRDKCNYVHPKAIYTIKKDYVYTEIKKSLKQNNKVIYFVNHASYMPYVCKEVLELDLVSAEEIALVMSDNREKEILSDCIMEVGNENAIEIFGNSKDVYESIVNNQYIPLNCSILISTSKLKEGIDIHNPNVTVICESHVLSDIVQFCGRVRVGNGIVYIVSDAKQHPVNPNQLLFDYARYECTSANQYLCKKQLDFTNGKERLIMHVCKNPYIYYDYITNKFTVFNIKYLEEMRLRKCHENWEERLFDYCKKYSISATVKLSHEKRIEILTDVLNKYLEAELYGEKREQLIDMIQSLLDISQRNRKKQISKINTLLEQNGLFFYFVSIKGTKVKDGNRDKTYWVVKEREGK